MIEYKSEFKLKVSTGVNLYFSMGHSFDGSNISFGIKAAGFKAMFPIIVIEEG